MSGSAWTKWFLVGLTSVGVLLTFRDSTHGLFPVALAQTPNIANTRHNLSSLSSNPTRAGAGETADLCVFCHTPHGAVSGAAAPLWNRSTSPVATYLTYSSSTLDAVGTFGGVLSAPGAESKLCLSCHDGTLAIGSGLANSPGSGTGNTITMTGTSNCDLPGTTSNTNCMPAGPDGATRRLGADLTNDHPISQTYDADLVTNDGELRARVPPHTVNSATVVDVRTLTTKPKLPLMTGQKVQCNTCHDPHIKGPDGNIAGTTRDAGKFLRLPRFQTTTAPGAPDLAKDQVCLGCHNKKGWVGSAHADSTSAAESYTDAAADARDFPRGTAVWQAACLNCHDTHSRTGVRRLLRNGLDAASKPAVEEVCYQCHQASGALGALAVTLTQGQGVPNIQTEFTGLNKIHMPISDADQRTTASEEHQIINADFMECRNRLGSTTSTYSTGLMGTATGTWSETAVCDVTPPVLPGVNDRRHAECTDCHNPHRVLKNRLFNSDIAGASANYRTHFPGLSTGGITNGSLNNLASGPLAGTWGVEPTYETTWLTNPLTFTIKYGQPTATYARGDAHLTREYQLCMKCHSNFAYEDNGQYGSNVNSNGGSTTDTKGDASGRPRLGSTAGSAGGTPPSATGLPASSNNMSTYTNQAAEFSVRANDSSTGTDQGASGANARRSWHPVHFPTGRTEALRGITTSGAFRAPFTNVGTQTMYCSDCHGAENSWTGGTGPDHTKVQGPHGSTNPFLLRAPWRAETGESNTGDLCFNCHNSTIYAGSTNTRATGYGHDEKDNHHNYHNADKATGINWRCSYCHVAVPHGWKNKAFLVNLADVGPEGGFASSTVIVDQSSGASNGYNNPPYYMRAKLRVSTWQASSAWTKGSCFGGEGGMSNQCGG